MPHNNHQEDAYDDLGDEDDDNEDDEDVVSCPTRWSLYRPLALCIDQSQPPINRETGYLNVLTKMMMISVKMTAILSSKVPFPPDSPGLAPDINGGVTTGEYHRGNPSKTLQKEELPQLFWFEGAIDFTTL